MGRKKKPFIDRRTAATFQIVTRSQRDPLINTSAPQNVLLPESLTRGPPKPLTKQQRLEEQAKYGIHFEDDDYDYLQHLKDANEVEEYSFVDERYRIYPTGEVVDAAKTVMIPSSMLPSQGVQLKVGLLNQAATQDFNPDLDPDVIAALDDDFDFDNPANQLEDDFIQLANPPPVEEAHQSVDTVDYDVDEDLDGLSVENSRCRFSDSSAMTCSTMRRSEGLQLLDRRFDKIFEEYDANSDTDEESPDARNTGMIKSLAQYAGLSQLTEDLKECRQDGGDDQDRSDLKSKVLHLASIEENKKKVLEEKQTKTPFDCESIISYASNIYNRPTVIDIPSKKRRRCSTGSAISVCSQTTGRSSLTRKTTGSRCSSFRSNVREKGETTDEKRLRKKLVKSEARERRMQKKATKIAFKTEELRNKLLELNALRNLYQMKLA